MELHELCGLALNNVGLSADKLVSPRPICQFSGQVISITKIVSIDSSSKRPVT